MNETTEIPQPLPLIDKLRDQIDNNRPFLKFSLNKTEIQGLLNLNPDEYQQQKTKDLLLATGQCGGFDIQIDKKFFCFGIETDESGNFVGVGIDVTKLTEDSKIDQHTGLENKPSYLKELANLTEQHKKAEASDPPILMHDLLIIMDANNLKKVNDTPGLGHTAGDALLEALAYKISICVRNVDKTFRIGGDEFAIISRRANDITATKICERLLSDCATIGELLTLKYQENPDELERKFGALDPVFLDGLPKMAVGTAFFNNNQTIPETIKEADQNMYANKVEQKTSIIL